MLVIKIHYRDDVRSSRAAAEIINKQIGTLFIHLWKVKIIEKVTDDVPMDTQSTDHNLIVIQ